jgi:hypothetical protein
MNILACGALANELVALKKLNDWQSIKIKCLPAHYHQTPQKIPQAVKKAIEDIRRENKNKILVAYGDCGTGGKLDEVLEQAGVARLPGAHCYQFFAGSEKFMQLHEAEIGTFYLTDFLVTHFKTFVWRALGLDTKPELLEMYFGNYKKLVYLAQTESEALVKLAQQHAITLGLEYEYHFTAYGEMGDVLSKSMNVAVPVVNHA